MSWKNNCFAEAPAPRSAFLRSRRALAIGSVVKLLLIAAAGCGGPLPETACSDCDVAVVQRAASVGIAPSADAFVRDGTSADSNFGTATTLEVKTTTSAGTNRIAYLRFPLSSISGTVTGATLRLQGSRPSNNGVLDSVFAVASTGWGETSITWNNKPSLGAAQGTGVAVTTTAQFYAWDVTSYVAAQKAAGATQISLAIKMDSNVTIGPDVFSSREATNFPRLDVTTGGSSPTVATPAAATPNPTSGTTTALSVLGADDGGESALTYTWAAGAASSVSFAPNGSNAAKSSVATFGAAGTYDLGVTIRDAQGQTAQSSVRVTVNPTVTSLAISPVTASIPPRASRTLVVTARDQFGMDMTRKPDLSWSASAGAVTSGGLFTAPTSGGPFTVTATGAGRSASATISLSTTTSVVTLAPDADAHVRDGTSAGTNFGNAGKIEVKSQSTAGNTRIAYLRFPLGGLGPVVSARLRLFGNRPSTNTVTDSAFAVADNGWSETTITWNNRPPLGAAALSPGVVVTPTAQYYEWDVTSFVEGQRNNDSGEVSLAVKMDSNVTIGPDSFNSREATGSRPQLVVTTGPCDAMNGCSCPLGSAGGTCASCAPGFTPGSPGVCTLINDGSFAEWPNAVSKANSDPWLVVHHAELAVVKPKVMVLDYANARCDAFGTNCLPVAVSEGTSMVSQIVASFREGSKAQGFKNPAAAPQWDYQVKFVDLRDQSGKSNSNLLPRLGGSLDVKQLFTAAYAVHFGFDDPAHPGQFLDLCTLVNQGLVNEVWMLGSGDTLDVPFPEPQGAAPFYTATGNQIPGRWNRCAGNGCFASDVPSCGRSLRIGGINHGRGSGCFIHGEGHGLEWSAAPPPSDVPTPPLPALREWFLPFAGYNFDTRYGLPFWTFYALGCPTPEENPACVDYPTTTHMHATFSGNPFDVDPFDPACGNVHWAPNSVRNYDYYKDRQVTTSCIGFGRHQGPGGSDATTVVDQQAWETPFSAFDDDCGGRFLIWWYQNMPGFGSGETFKDGRSMKSPWPFLYY
jgi:hypothetical protein